MYPLPPPKWPLNPNHDNSFAPKPNVASGTKSDVGVTAEADVSEEADCAGTASGTPDNAVNVAVFSGVGYDGSAINGIPTEGASAPPSAIAGPDGGATASVDTDAAAGGDLESPSSPVGAVRMGDLELRLRPCPTTDALVPVRAESGAASVSPGLGSEPNPGEPAGTPGFARAVAVAPPRRGPVFGEADGRVVLVESAVDDAVPAAPPEPVESA